MDKFLTYHSPDYQDDVRVTIVAKVIDEPGAIKLTFGASRCAKDNQFNKKEGRERAISRSINISEQIMELTLFRDHWTFKQLILLFRQISSDLATEIIEDSRKVRRLIAK